jgi:hypothetical protein
MTTVKVISWLGSPFVAQTWHSLPADPMRAALSAGPQVKASYVITPGENQLDADFWREWKEQHKETILLEHLDEVAEQPKENA